jgi:hypothetical protein
VPRYARIPCHRCRGLNVRVADGRSDPDLLDDLARTDPALARALAAAGVDATVWRVRLCLDCGAVRYTAEVPADGRQVRARLRELRAQRYQLLRSRRPAR